MQRKEKSLKWHLAMNEIKQKDIARAAGVTNGTVSAALTGQCPSPRVIAVTARLLEKTERWVLAKIAERRKLQEQAEEAQRLGMPLLKDRQANATHPVRSQGIAGCDTAMTSTEVSP